MPEEEKEDDVLEFDPDVFEDEYARIVGKGRYRKRAERVLLVTAPDGARLWEVFSDSEGSLDRVIMADGGIVKRAEGTDYYILAMRGLDDCIQFYIVETLVLDPETGNLYFEANKGGYTAAFLNSGWQAHHYSRPGFKKSFVVEPGVDGKRKVIEVAKLAIDIDTREVQYEEISGSTWVILDSRKL